MTCRQVLARRRDKGNLVRMFGRFSVEPMAEVEIRGSAAELAQLAAHVRAVEITRLREDHDPHPYAERLATIEIRDAKGKVGFEIDASSRCLVVAGDAASRDMLAGNIESMWDAMDDGGHVHVDYYPEHPFLAPGRASVVFAHARVGDTTP